jgi:hypothetical protein
MCALRPENEKPPYLLGGSFRGFLDCFWALLRADRADQLVLSLDDYEGQNGNKADKDENHHLMGGVGRKRLPAEDVKP